jgi:dinuclear metal center YbgI/SA1388 family protein
MLNSSPKDLKDLVEHLDRYLETSAFSDASANGLQVEGSETVRRVGLAVDACLASILQAAEKGCDLLIVHHGLLWGEEIRLCGPTYRRVRALIEADIALYASHLPLDAHPEVGNNIQIARRMSLSDVSPFGKYRGISIGFQGCLEEPTQLQEALAVCSEKIGPPKTILQFGQERIRRLGIITGSASDAPIFDEAAHSGIDLLVTGEPKQAAYNLAQEYGLNVFYGGHYHTETFGVKALGEHLTERFGLPTEFIETACPF